MIASHGKKYIFDLFDDHFNQTLNPKEGDLVAWRDNKYGACGIMTGGRYLTVSKSGGVCLTNDKFYRAWSLNE